MQKTDQKTLHPLGADASCILEELRGLSPQERRELLRLLTEQYGMGMLRKVKG